MLAQKHKFNDDWDYLITHGSVIRAVIDYVFLAMKGVGRVIIGDGPSSESKFCAIVNLMGLREIRQVFKNHNKFEIEIINLQDEFMIERDGIYVDRVQLPGDPRGGVIANLGKDSMFSELDCQGKRYYGAYYDVEETNRRHKEGNHEYVIAKSPIIADVFINIPKLKTHKKCGITVNLKSLVGINANRNWLPHYMFGSPETGGDQFDKKRGKSQLENNLVLWVKNSLKNDNVLMKFLARKLKKVAYIFFGDTEAVVRSGNWYGNDTVWRMCIDLNRILMYANSEGVLVEGKKTKRFLSIVDGIASMEGNGPLAGTRKETGLIIVGDNPVAVDAVCAKIMGFDYGKLHIIDKALKKHKYPLIDGNYESIYVLSNREIWNKPLNFWNVDNSLKFKPHFGWIGHIEDSE